MVINVRESRLDDAEALLGIWRRSVDATHHFLASHDRADIDPLVAAYVRDAALTVATLNGNPVGFMGITEQHIDSLFLRRMGFSPTGRSDFDGEGRPYPLLHMRRN
jgi:putative acetyltransferase